MSSVDQGNNACWRPPHLLVYTTLPPTQASAADKKIKAFLKEQEHERIRRENEAKAEALGHR